jgi:hypothetical protein
MIDPSNYRPTGFDPGIYTLNARSLFGAPNAIFCLWNF